MHLSSRNAANGPEFSGWEKPTDKSVLERVSDAVVALDGKGCYTYLNSHAGQLFGRNPQDLVGKHIWSDLPEGIAGPLRSAYETALAERRFVQVETYDQPKRRWYENRIFPAADGLSIFFHDITDRKEAEQAAQESADLLHGQNRVLKLIAQGDPLPRTLDLLLRIIEEQSPGLLASILLIDHDGIHVRHGAAPSLPEAYVRSIDGSCIGPGAGSCGTAAYRREPVIVEDIPTDPLWVGYRDLAMAHGLRSCWSTPIFDEQQRVLGTFALYCHAPGRPSASHLKHIAMATYTASIAIVKHREREALAAAEQRLRTAIAAGNIGLWERDIRSNRLVWSAQLEQIIGYPAEENTDFGKLLESVHPDDRARVMATVQRPLSRPVPADLEFRVIWPDGSVHWIAARGKTDYSNAGEPLCVRSVGLDITDRKQIEDELRVRENQLADAQRVANCGSYEWLPGTGTVRWTDQLYRIFGQQPDGFYPTLQSYLESIHPEDRESTRMRIEQCMRDGVEFEGEERIVRPDGSTRLLLSQGRWLFDQSRQEKKLVGTCQDITARREAERSRIRLEEELRQMHKMESIGRLTGGVAHDFNNLLTVILGHVALFRHELPPRSTANRHLDQIEEAAMRAAALTRHLLAFSRRQVIQPAVLDLNAAVTNLNRMMTRVIGEHISLRVIAGQSLGRVKADLGQIDQILMNLIVNAVDAMPKGGEIVIEIKNIELDQNCPESHPSVPPGRYVVLSVTDTGCGMDAQTMSQIFEPFFTTKAPGQGTGLGLSLVYGAVQQAHGYINVSSEPGRGTTFTIYLPRIDEDPAPPTALAGQAGHRGSETILLVEDDDVLRDLTTTLLANQGYKILPAVSTSSAVALAQSYRQKIDLLLTDVVMPEMSGPDLAAQLRLSRPGLQVLYMSGYAGNLLSLHGILETETALLQKPFTEHGLLASVANVFQRLV